MRIEMNDELYHQFMHCAHSRGMSTDALLQSFLDKSMENHHDDFHVQLARDYQEAAQTSDPISQDWDTITAEGWE